MNQHLASMNTSTKKLAQIGKHNGGGFSSSNSNNHLDPSVANTNGGKIKINAFGANLNHENTVRLLSQRLSNKSDDTPGFNLSLDQKFMMLYNSNPPPESPGFVFTGTGSSSKGLVHKDS